MSREYRYRPKKGRFKKRFTTIVLIAGLLAGGHAICKNLINTGAVNTSNVEYPMLTPAITEQVTVTPEPTPVVTPVPTEVPTPEVTPVTHVDNGVNKGDSVTSIKSVNLRLGPTTESFRLGELPRNTTVDRIMSIDGFDLIRYDGRLAFVSTDFTSVCDVDYNNDYYYIEEEYDIVRTTSSLYFRLGPSKNESDIELLPKKEELVVIGKAIPYSNPDDVWYLVKHKDKIGFVNAAYTISLKAQLQGTLPDINDLKIIKIASIKTRTDLLNANGDSYKKISAYQLVKVLIDYGDFTLIEYGDSVGLVRSADLKSYKGILVSADLGDQKVFMYCYTDLVFEDVCTTGKDGMLTRAGDFTVSERTNSRYFSEEAQARYLWARFDGGNGFHDAPWEDQKNFGKNSFRKRNGSKGCIRLTDSAALFLRDYLKVGTQVLVQD